MAHARYLEALQPDALLSHRLFHALDIEQARAGVAKVFSTHELNVVGTGQDIDSRMYHLPLGGVSLSRLSYGAAVEIDPGRVETFYLVGMPISGACDVSYGKGTMRSDPRMAAVISPTKPLRVRWQKGCDKLLVKIDRSLLERHCAQHLGHEISRPIEFAQQMELDPHRSWRQLIGLIVTADASQQGDMLSSPLIRAQFEHMVVSTLLFDQPNNYSDDLRQPARQIAPYYVKRVEEYIYAHAHKPITALDLTKHAGVSMRALYAGFQNFRRISPMAFVKSVRLDRIRNDLLAGGPNRETVAEIAMRWGCRHHGHFTANYKRKFGETPSETLHRSRS